MRFLHIQARPFSYCDVLPTYLSTDKPIRTSHDILHNFDDHEMDGCYGELVWPCGSLNCGVIEFGHNLMDDGPIISRNS